MNELPHTKVLLTGGGTAGSVTPLLAIADELGRERYEFLWVGTRNGVERRMVAQEKLPFKFITAVKLHRFFSLYTLVYTLFTPLLLFIGLAQALFVVAKFRPAWIVTGGSFVSVPVVWAGWLLRRKILVHQQDVEAGLANKLMAPFARVITVTFEKSLEDYGKKARWVGNPVRIKNLELKNQKFFNVKFDLPLVFIFGGGTGARFLNELVVASLPELTKFCQIIHVSGRGKKLSPGMNYANYYPYEFLDYKKIMEAYGHADLVVARAGMATITELSYFGKPAIIIPMPDTHQVANATLLESESAAVVLDQPALEQVFFVKKIKELLADRGKQQECALNIKKIIKHGATRAIADMILSP